jgi:hypothetical protein
MIAGWISFLLIWLTLASTYAGVSVLGLAVLTGYGAITLHRRRSERQPIPQPQTGQLTSCVKCGRDYQEHLNGWCPVLPQGTPPRGERNSRHIPQDVRIRVAARDQGRCRQCQSDADLHYDHVIPYSRAGANTSSNIQLLCGRCNRAKGADDIPV